MNNFDFVQDFLYGALKTSLSQRKWVEIIGSAIRVFVFTMNASHIREEGKENSLVYHNFLLYLRNIKPM
jgi:hypothetical protein